MACKRCSSRNCANFAASAGSSFANIATANKAALAAPASPIAKVATGTPLGICTIDYSESTPLQARVVTGTPNTGTMVLAANIPGK